MLVKNKIIDIFENCDLNKPIFSIIRVHDILKKYHLPLDTYVNSINETMADCKRECVQDWEYAFDDDGLLIHILVHSKTGINPKDFIDILEKYAYIPRKDEFMKYLIQIHCDNFNENKKDYYKYL